MKLKTISLIAAVFAICIPAIADNQIDSLVTKLNSDKLGLWVNGGYPVLALPSEAATNTVIKKATQVVGFDKGRIKSYEIIEMRDVKLKAQPNCSAVLLKTNLGDKILLFKFDGNDWWTRFFDVQTKSPNQGMEPTSANAQTVVPEG